MYDESFILAGGESMRKRIQMCILTGCCIVCLSGCAKSKEVQEKQLALRTQGMQQALEGDYEAAVASYEEALQLADLYAGPLELDIAAYKASAQYRAGETAKAIETCSAILDLKESAQIYMTRGLMYRESGNVQAANADFAKAKELTPKKDTVTLGRLSYYMEDYAGAKSYLESAADGGDQEALYWEAKLYWQMGNTDYAVTLFQSYLEGESLVHQDAYARVASWQMEQGDYDGALVTLESGIAQGEGGSLKELLGNEIAVYEQKGDFETAKLKMESYLERYPDDEKAQREYIFLKTR